MKKEDAYSKMWRYVFGVFGCIDEAQQNFEGSEHLFRSLTVAQTRMLRVVRGLLDEAPRGITLKELAHRLNISAAAASEMVEVLVKKGLLVRTVSSEDRRAVSISFAPGVLERGSELETLFSGVIGELCSDFSDAELEQLTQLMARMYMRASRMHN